MNKRVLLPVEPLTEEKREILRGLRKHVLLGFPPGGNAWQGHVELSFAMDWHVDRVRIWTDTWGDGRENSERHMQQSQEVRPDWQMKVFNLEDEDLPIIIDIEKWIDDQAYNPNTLSGVTDKFAARNAPFKMKE